MKLIVGLGNPGTKYRLTRHNIGFMVLDYLSAKHDFSFKAGKGSYYFAKQKLSTEDVFLVKPTTYMNRSGLAVRQVMDYFKVNLDDLLVIYDDFHLPLGELRFRGKGSSGGHNGIQSIIDHLGTQQFQRLKIGIGDQFRNAVDFVLTPFNKKEQEVLEIIIPAAAEGVFTWLRDGLDTAMNLYNRNVIEVE
ncbi:MAG TPA: aminoacyl-tRNA hydrolase [Caldithrix abyssi]|uniref:Peptidyl-tRNA hydrolase n=1 Tax=Caldithrix abyssi TaxID=187145 RepID=A0A7V4TZQ8_CALAY|nr:aminoacyl-tRNA hydrolase [Caldithrix abyssi]